MNPRDAIDNIAHDIVFSNDQFRSSPDMSPAEKIYFNQTGAKNAMLAAKWVRDNLGKAKATMNNLIKEEAKALQGELANMIATLESQTAAQAKCEERRLSTESKCTELKEELKAAVEALQKGGEERKELVEAKVSKTWSDDW